MRKNKTPYAFRGVNCVALRRAKLLLLLLLLTKLRRALCCILFIVAICCKFSYAKFGAAKRRPHRHRQLAHTQAAAVTFDAEWQRRVATATQALMQAARLLRPNAIS